MGAVLILAVIAAIALVAAVAENFGDDSRDHQQQIEI
jgi:hypothetical protein